MKYNYCEKCFNPNKGEEICGTCKRNPKNVYVNDSFIDYPICCPFSYTDCIHDPGYIWQFHHDWFIKLYGDISPFKVKDCEDCEEGSEYDDEDK